MFAQLHRPLLLLPLIGLCAILVFAHGAAAQSGTGTVTGRVLWGPCLRGIPLPMTPDGQPVPATPNNPVPPDAQIAPGSRVVPNNGLPAGAVLVAVQNTAVNARTDETGRFTLSGVPAGQYMTIAAGPVADSVSAIAERPNVFVSSGQSVDVGSLSLGGQGALSISCRFPYGPQAVPGADTTTTTPGDIPNP
jgi:hypothetical protein